LSNSSEPSNKPPASTLTKGVRGVLHGRISFAGATREAFRRGRAAVRRRRERAMLDELSSQTARLKAEFQRIPSSDLLKHFREREAPAFFPGFQASDFTASRQRDLFPDETEWLIQSAWRITKEHRWPLLGLGEKEFGHQINWHRDPLSGRIWPLDYHADIPLWHNDGSDIRVLWELNRLGHLITLGRAYALTKDEEFAAEFFAQVESWREQNRVGRGANWSCAMEVALRAMNLLAAFYLFRGSPTLNEARLLMLLMLFDQHGAHIRRNLESSHLSTSNHYLSDVAGLLWLGIMLPELSASGEWRAWALPELLREMDKQILPDGADYETSTGYHRFVLELFLYSFILCRANDIPIADKYWRKLHKMLVYLCTILRPDGLAPLIGDTDGGQVFPIVSRSGNDHAYLLALGVAVFKDSQFKLPDLPGPQELLWLLGEAGLHNFQELPTATEEMFSQAFADAGTYILRRDDLFLLFNANGGYIDRPASHRHNDALSIEISACGSAFIVDPGSYLYTADLHERHLFRSTASHSTVEIDGVEQNTIREDTPFVNGAEARVRVSLWENTFAVDRVSAKHSGYERLVEPVRHQRSISFYKQDRWWLIEDEITGRGVHEVTSRFHFAAGLEVSVFDNSVLAHDKKSGACLIVCSLDIDEGLVLDAQFTSAHYGLKAPSVSARWVASLTAPAKLRWAIVPVCEGEDKDERLRLIVL
jgi:hypothetical protein